MHKIDKNKLSNALGKNFSPLDEIAVSIIKHKVIAVSLKIPIEKNRYY